MKKIFAIMAAAAIFASCNNKEQERQLQASRDSLKAVQASMKMDSLKKANEVVMEQKAEADRQVAVAQARASEARSARRTQVAGYSESGSTPQTVVVEERKQGMKSGTKGALIGAGAGALTGVLVDKKNGRGAVIGGLVGAGTGYVIGHKKDKKTGRVQ